MFKKLFVTTDQGSTESAKENPLPAETVQRRPELAISSFDEIYRRAPVRSSSVAYSILKVAEMTHSPHLEGMSSEARRNSVLMALEAAGVPADDLLQDAMVRQRALNEHEETLKGTLKTFETTKIEENRRIQAELDRITAQHMSRIQSNLDQVARQQDLFRAWQTRKEQESRRISDAAAVCMPKNAEAAGEGLTLLLTGAPRR